MEREMEAMDLPESDRDEVRKFREFLRDRKRYREEQAADPDGKRWEALAARGGDS